MSSLAALLVQSAPHPSPLPEGEGASGSRCKGSDAGHPARLRRAGRSRQDAGPFRVVGTVVTKTPPCEGSQGA